MSDHNKSKKQLLAEIKKLKQKLHNFENSKSESKFPLQEEKFEILADQSPNMIFINFKGKIIFANNKCKEIMGYSKEEFCADDFNFLMLIAPAFRDMVKVSYNNHLQGQEVNTYECTLVTKYKKEIHVIVTTKLISIAGETAILGIVTDISERIIAEKALEESESRYHKLLELSFDGNTIHQDGKIVFINQKGALVLGADSPSQLLGKNIVEFLHPDFREIAAQRIKQSKRAGADLIEGKFIGLDGKTVDVEVVGIPITYNGKPARQAIFRDISKRKQAEELLRRSKELYKKLVDTLPDAVLVVDLEGTITNISNRALELFGYKSSGELIGKKGFVLLSPKDRESAQEKFKSIFKTESIRGIEYTVLRKDGSEFVAEINATILKNADNDPIGFITIVRDISFRKKAESELLDYQKQLQSFASRLTLTEEKERRKIANEIHNRLGQSLALSKIKLSELQGNIRSEPNSTSLQEIREIIEALIEETRTLTFELSPPVLYELGFEPAVEWLAEQFQKRHKISINIKDDGKEKSLDDDLRFILFDAVRELLINVVKHARAKNVSIALNKESSFYHVHVKDDGVGFNVSILKPERQKKQNFGYFQIKERLKLLDGELKIQSSPGKGTNVSIKAPLK